jgi:hypothetical protein
MCYYATKGVRLKPLRSSPSSSARDTRFEPRPYTRTNPSTPIHQVSPGDDEAAARRRLSPDLHRRRPSSCRLQRHGCRHAAHSRGTGRHFRRGSSVEGRCDQTICHLQATGSAPSVERQRYPGPGPVRGQHVCRCTPDAFMRLHVDKQQESTPRDVDCQPRDLEVTRGGAVQTETDLRLSICATRSGARPPDRFSSRGGQAHRTRRAQPPASRSRRQRLAS